MSTASPHAGASSMGAVRATMLYLFTLVQLIFGGKKYSQISAFGDDTWAKVQVYSLSLIFKMWSKPHYRSPSFKQDMIDNLRNVAIPGTGIPLSVFCHMRITCLYFIFVLNPLVCLIGALNKARRGPIGSFYSNLSAYYVQHLLRPDDWFSFWRLNCRLASYHSMLLDTEDYQQEDKWTFLVSGAKNDVPVTPFMDSKALVIKHKSIEGGMGIHFFRNALDGGDWIIQEKLDNAAWLNELLPGNSPLSTLRIITSSTYTLRRTQAEVQANAGAAEGEANSFRQVSSPIIAKVKSVGTEPQPATGKDEGEAKNKRRSRSRTRSKEESEATSNGQNGHKVSKTPNAKGAGGRNGRRRGVSKERDDAFKYIKALSGVLRLGRAGASTDHSSVLFDVDISTGELKRGISNAQWYQLGLKNILTCPWLPKEVSTTHPDSHVEVTGQYIPAIDDAVDIVTRAHFKLMKDVPMVGWDVAFTPSGVYLLEVNLSCNFFRGSFDIPAYINMVDAYWRSLEEQAGK